MNYSTSLHFFLLSLVSPCGAGAGGLLDVGLTTSCFIVGCGLLSPDGSSLCFGFGSGTSTLGCGCTWAGGLLGGVSFGGVPCGGVPCGGVPAPGAFPGSDFGFPFSPLVTVTHFSV